MLLQNLIRSNTSRLSWIAAFAIQLAPLCPLRAEDTAGFTTAVPDTLATRDSTTAPEPRPTQSAFTETAKGTGPVLDLGSVTVKRSRTSDAPRKAALDASILDLRSRRSAPVDVKNAIQSVAGVNLRQNGGVGSNFELNLNGLQGKAVKVFVDGVPQDARSAELALSTLGVEDLDRVELYKGVLPAEMGADALGGGINLVTRKLNHDAAELSYEAGSFGEHRFSGRVNKKLPGNAFARAEGSWGVAENDYPMEVLAVDPFTRKLKPINVDRFHDAFSSYNAETRLGFKDQPRIGDLEAGFRFSAIDKEFQHGASTLAPYGDVKGRISEVSPRLVWNRGWLDDRLKSGLRADYAWNRTTLIDTGSSQYFWNGSSQVTSRTGGEIGATNKSLARQQTHSVTTREGARYNLDSSHSLVANHTWIGLERYGSDPLGTRLLGSGLDPLAIPSEYHRHYATMGLEGRILKGRVGYEAIAKGFGYFLKGPEGSGGYWGGDYTRRSGSFFGAAAGLKWEPGVSWTLRTGYERALRLPDQDEVLGDGFFLLPNYNLLPERSHNLNFGAGWIPGGRGNGRLGADVSAFARLQDDIIVQRTIGFVHSTYLNDEQARSTGLELGAWWQPWKGGRMDGNATYQSLRKQSAKDRSEDYLIDSRLPNIPYFFANLALGQQLKALLGTGDALELSWNARYVQEFLLYPIPKESEGDFFWEKPSVKTEYLIPSQFIQNIGFTYHLPGRWASFGFEARNIFDEAAYDNFRVPKPGRSFHGKLTARY